MQTSGLVGFVIVVAFLAFMAGSRYTRMRGTFADYKDLRRRARILGRLRWPHLGSALGWATLVLIVVILSLAGGTD